MIVFVYFPLPSPHLKSVAHTVHNSLLRVKKYEEANLALEKICTHNDDCKYFTGCNSVSDGEF